MVENAEDLNSEVEATPKKMNEREDLACPIIPYNPFGR